MHFLSLVLDNRDIYHLESTPEQRKQKWNEITSKLQSHGIPIQMPKSEHLYNTILIPTDNTCPLSIIDELAEKNIYIGTISACANESEFKHLQQDGGSNQTSPEFAFVRLSFMDASKIDDKCLNEICKTLKHE